MLRLIRAVIIALRMTLRGETPPVSPYQPLLAWIDMGAKLAGKVVSKTQTDTDLWQLTFKIEGREQSAATTLKAVLYHMDTEYPYMMRHFTNQSINAIYATNMNDQFAMSKLLESARGHDLHLIQQLADHLNTIPPSSTLE